MKELIEAVKKQGGWDAAEWRQVAADVVKHGGDTGWNGFTYYFETTDFYDRHKSEILELVEDVCKGIGSPSIADFVDSLVEPLGVKNALWHLLKNDDEAVFVKNALAWLALEEAARATVEGDE